jgi:glycosyltransferase involved in cell wall biosynthesis
MDVVEDNTGNLVSVIINCYNSEAYIKKAIESVIAQTYNQWEIILWDNQSNDKTREIILGFNDDRIKYYLSSTFTNLSLARKHAIQKASGTYLAFLDSDDYWHPNKLSLQIVELKKDNDVGIVHTNFKLVSENDNLKVQLQKNYYATIKQFGYSNKKIYKRLLYSNFIIFSSLVIRKNIYDQIGGINDNFNQNEDYELLLKASLITNSTNISQDLTYYRIHSNNQSHGNIELSYIENQIIFKSLHEKYLSTLAYFRNNFRYNYFLFKANKKSIFYLLNPFNCYFFIEFILKKINK